MTGNGKMKTDRYDEILFEELQNEEFAVAYLSNAFDEAPDVFLLALRQLIEARGGIGKLAIAHIKSRKLNQLDF